MIHPRKKSGAPLLKNFTDPLYLHAINPLCEHINHASLKVATHQSTQNLAILIYNFIACMDKYFGKFGEYRHLMTKIPVHIFRDYSVGGSLHEILKMILVHPVSFLENLLDTTDLALLNAGMQFFVEVDYILREKNFLAHPKVYFGSTVPSDQIPHLRTVVSKHKGEIVKVEKEATHIIEWDDEVDNLPVEVTEEFLRPIEFLYQDGIAKVHWWYSPDSYDEAIPLNEVDDPSDAPDAHFIPPQWRVCCRWIRDTDMFNEWGNEVDYEIDSESMANKDNIMEDDSNAPTPKRKRTRRKYTYHSKKDVYQGTQIVPTSLQSTEKMMANFLPPSADSSIQVLHVAEVSSTGMEMKQEVRDNEGGNAGPTKRKATADVTTSNNKRAHTSSDEGGGPEPDPSRPHPSFPLWFHRDKVHSSEKLYLPEFFDGSSPYLNETIYMKMRNFIIDEYALTPHIYLSGTACRKKFSGDARAVLALQEYLDCQNIINYAVDPPARPLRSALVLPYNTLEMKPTLNTAPAAMSTALAVDKLPPDVEARLLNAIADCDAGDWTQVATLMDGALTAQECLRYFSTLSLFEAPSQVETSLTNENVTAVKMEVVVVDNEDNVVIPSPVVVEEEGDRVKRDMLLEYMAIRMQAVEEKIKLFKSVEALLDIERDKVNLDKRDNQTLKAQIAYQQNQLLLVQGAIVK